MPLSLYQELKAHPAPVLLGNPRGNYLCRNCAGFNDGELRLMFLKAWDGRGVNTWHDGKWWGYDERRVPCPICNTDNTALIAYLKNRSGLEDAHFAIDPARYRQDEEKADAVNAVLKILAQTPTPKGWLTLHGGYGVGKTFLLRGLVAKSVLAGVYACYTSSALMLADIKRTYNPELKGVTESDVITRYEGARVLCIDEFDRVHQTEWAMQKMFEILDARYQARHKFATVLATNLAPDEFSGEWKYLASRMRDGMRVVMGGRDLRGERP